MAVPAVAAFPHNLPLMMTSFHGRFHELNQIQENLLSSHCRLFSLIGLGGIGKSRLALAAARQIVESQPVLFADGVYWVALTAVVSRQEVVVAIATALKFVFSGQADPEAQLLNYLRRKKLLLLLDNWEQLAEETTFLTDLLQAAPQLKLLVTSRQRLNLSAEWLLTLTGLTYPENDQEDSARFDAVELFAQRARQVNLNFDLAAELSDVLQICRLVKGMPLGLELAASWVGSVSCADIAQTIAKNKDALTTGWHDVPDRHRSLRATFDYSWKLLTKERQTLFTQLAIFCGGFTAVAAQQVTGAALSGFSALVDKSLLQRQGNGRYEMHELLRQFALEKESNPDLLRQKHANFYAQFVAQYEPGVRYGRLVAIQTVSQDIDNIRAGWRWAVTMADYQMVSHYLTTIVYLYELRGWFQEGEAMLAEAIGRFAEKYADETEPEFWIIQSQLLAWQGRFNYILGNNQLAETLLLHSLDLSRRYGSTPQTARALSTLGLVKSVLGENQAAKQYAEESLKLYTIQKDQDGKSAALTNLGFILIAMGDFAAAALALQESLDLAQRLDNRQGQMQILILLGNVHNALGEYERAEALYRQGIAIALELNNQWNQASLLVNLCVVAKRREQYKKAAQVGHESLALFTQLGAVRGQAVALKNLGDIALAQGFKTEARQNYQSSLQIRQKIGDRFGVALTLHGLASLADSTEARTYYYEALRIAVDIEAIALILYMLPDIATFLAQLGDCETAVSILNRVIAHESTEAHTRQRVQQIRGEIDKQFRVKLAAEIGDRWQGFSLAQVATAVLAKLT